MKYLLVVISLLILTGCATSIDEEQLERIYTICNKNDGIDVIRVSSLNPGVKCKDGARFAL